MQRATHVDNKPGLTSQQISQLLLLNGQAVDVLRTGVRHDMVGVTVIYTDEPSVF